MNTRMVLDEEDNKNGEAIKVEHYVEINSNTMKKTGDKERR